MLIVNTKSMPCFNVYNYPSICPKFNNSYYNNYCNNSLVIPYFHGNKYNIKI